MTLKIAFGAAFALWFALIVVSMRRYGPDNPWILLQIGAFDIGILLFGYSLHRTWPSWHLTPSVLAVPAAIIVVGILSLLRRKVSEAIPKPWFPIFNSKRP